MNSNTYEFCFLDEINNGVQYVRFDRIRSRPNDEWPDGTLLRARAINRVQEQTGTTTDPETGEEVAVMSAVADKYHKWNGVELVAMTDSERTERDAYDLALAAVAEAARQAAKSDALKAVENNFYTLCAALGLAGKPTFAEINAALTAMQSSDPDTAVVLSLKLLAIDAEGKREGGLEWWDDAATHAE